MVKETTIARLATVSGAVAPTYSTRTTLATLGSLPAEVFTRGSVLECVAGGRLHIVTATGRRFHHMQGRCIRRSTL